MNAHGSVEVLHTATYDKITINIKWQVYANFTDECAITKKK